MSPWDIPVFRMAYFAQKSHRDFCSKTLMLQVRFAHPPNPAPSYRLFVLFSKTHDLQVRFAHPPSAHRSPVSSPLAAAAALWLPCVRGAVRRRAGLRGCLRIRGKGKGRRPSPVSAPNRLFKLRWCFARLIRQAETHDLQPHSRPPSKHTVLFLPKRSCSRFASLTLRLRTKTFFQKVPVFRMAYFAIPHRPTFGAPVFRRAYWLRQTLRLQPLRGLHRSAPRCLL